MSSNIEMDDLSNSCTRKTTPPRPPLEEDPGSQRSSPRDGAIYVWAWTSAAILALFSTCLLAFPRFLLFLAEPSWGRGALTSLEKCLALYLGIILGTLAVAIIAMLPNEWPTGLQRRPDPDRHPLLGPITAASLLMALFSYDDRSLGTLTTCVLFGSGTVGLFGLWMLVFSGTSAISRKTGADKHTSAFIFGNKSAASVKKRLWKRGQTN